MTKEEATKILARMLETDANDTFLSPNERSAIIFALQDMNGAERMERKPKPQPIYITDDGKIIPLPEPQALPLPEDWKAGAELCRMINANIDARIKHFLELEKEWRAQNENSD